MPVTAYTITCLAKKLIARDVYEFVFTKPEGFTFKPGQFVLFDVPHHERTAEIQPRAFSIASTPAEHELLFVVKLLAGGRASLWFEHVVEEGSTAVIKGPFGNFLLDPAPDKQLLFIATSTGIAPFRSQMLAALSGGDTRKMDLIFGVRAEEDLFWEADFQRMAQQYPNVFLHITLSGGSPAWTGHRGRVLTLIPHVAPEMASTLLYACGNPEMTKEVKLKAVGEWGMDKKMVHVEGYI